MAPGKTTPLTSMSVFCAMSSSNRGGPLSLPLLEGLLTRPGAADACVKDALHRWRAGHRISSFIYRHFQSSTGGINKRRTRRMSTFQSSHHWLIQGLQSPSQMERRVAFQILGQGCLLDKHSVWEVLEIISHLLRAKETKSRAILLTLMDHIVMQILSKAERLAFLKNSRLGLNFLCQWLWKITSDPKGANIENIPSLVGFLHRVILDSNETHALLWQKIGKQPSFPQLSPLACLIGCYQICKTSPILKASVMDSSIILLKQLIDPFPSLPTNKVASKDNEKPLRLIETFANTKSEDATVQTSTGTSSSTTIGRHRSSSSSSLSQSSRRRPISVSMQEERSAAAAAVARIFSAVYGNDEDHDVDIVVGAAEQSDEEMLENSEQIPEEKQEQAEDVDSEQEGKINDNSDEEARDDGDIASEDDNEEDQEEDEEINSDEGEEEEDEEEEDSDERDDHDNELVIHEEEVDVSDLLEFGDMNVDEPLNEHPQTSINPNTSPSVSQKTVANPQIVKERRQYYIQASMEILQMQYPPLRHSIRNESPKNGLSVKAEHALMTSIVNIVKPPKKPVNTKIILRRAPTQEEFFRGSLSKNPVSLNMLKSHQNQNEPTVKDLRQHIANDLQMSDSAELLELICANKILDVNLKLRVVHQVVWKEHLLQHAPASGSSSERSASVLSSFLEGGGSSGRSFISTGSGLSMIFSSGFERSLSGGSSAFNISPDTPLSALPPMIVTYRLTGVDGEATEDTVSTLQDPEAPAETTSSEELERLMEQKFGITRLATAGRGVFCLLRSIERSTNDTLRKIRRDDVILVETPYESAKKNPNNPSRSTFKATSPSPGLELLLCCSKLPSNRKLLLKSRAPTILLRLLLSVLHALEEDGSEDELASESNSVAKALQKLIETLASDMVSSTDTIQKDEEAEDVEQDASTLRLLLSAIETSSLSRPLRNIIAKLLPYLTYGQPALSKELACKFVHHVTPERLQQYGLHEGDKEDATRLILVATFIHTSISLPPNPVCNSLRFELLQSGFLERIAAFLLQDIPKEPPSWSPSLWPKSKCMSEDEKVQLEGQWRHYLNRPGLKTSFDILIGLCKQHEPTQTFLGSYKMYKDKLPLILACHWLESTSDGSRIAMKGIGLVAETLLDELAQDSSSVTEKVKEIRRNTRNRKKEIAMERRKRALVSIGSFGPSADTIQIENEKVSVRGTAASLLAPVLGLFGASEPSDSSPPSKRRKKDNVSPADKNTSVKPAWMTEMENMQDEDGLTCAVCQEGRTLQPSELLGLYAYVKKVSIPMNQCGARASIDGTDLLTSLPVSSPDSISDSHAALEWFPAAKAAGEVLHDYSRSSSTASSKRAIHTTTVSAGNGIHFSCHTKARQADRSHPKARKYFAVQSI